MAAAAAASSLLLLLPPRRPACHPTSPPPFFNPPISPSSPPPICARLSFARGFAASDTSWALQRSVEYHHHPGAYRSAVAGKVDDRRGQRLGADGGDEGEGEGRGEHELRAEYGRMFGEASENDEEIREMISETFGDPEQLRRRIQARIQRKGRSILQPKTGSAYPLMVSFKDFDPTDGYIWLELYNAPSAKDIDIIGSVIRSWLLLGRLGGLDSLNIQLTRIPINESLRYNHNRKEEPLPAYFQNSSDLEFQHNQGRFWVDLGTSDPLAMDILINALKAVNSDHVGIKQLTFDGSNLCDWEEGMTSEESGYKIYKF